MGEERAWKGKRVFFCAACCLSMLSGLIGCVHPVKEWHGRHELREAELRMGRGEYEASMQQVGGVLQAHPLLLGDQALFQLGLLYAHPKNPLSDNAEAAVCFKRLLSEYPLSEKREEARLWLLTLKNMKAVSVQLEREAIAAKQAAETAQRAVEEKELKLKFLKDQLEQREKKLTQEHDEINLLRNRVAELEAQLAKLKNVDLTIEKKKRSKVQ
jgi:hypothetical protein